MKTQTYNWKESTFKSNFELFIDWKHQMITSKWKSNADFLMAEKEVPAEYTPEIRDDRDTSNFSEYHDLLELSPSVSKYDDPFKD